MALPLGTMPTATAVNRSIRPTRTRNALLCSPLPLAPVRRWACSRDEGRVVHGLSFSRFAVEKSYFPDRFADYKGSLERGISAVMSTRPELPGKIFPTNSGIVPMTSGRLPA